MKSEISASDAQRSFSDVLSRVKYRGERFVVVRGGQPVAEIGPAGPRRMTWGQLYALIRSVPAPDAAFAADIEAAIAAQPPAELTPWGA